MQKWMQGKANKSPCCTTQGWQLQVRWRDGSASWEHLHNLKESNPIEVVEYAMADKLEEEPAFAWWVPYTLQHYRCIINALTTSQTACRTQKFGIEDPRSKEIKTGAADRQAKEMLNVQPAFEILQHGAKQPIASKWIPCHMIFDVKWTSHAKPYLLPVVT